MSDNRLIQESVARKTDEGFEHHDRLVRVTRAAIGRAKRRGSEEVTPDDLLLALLHSIARFGIALVGPVTIDLEAFCEDDPVQMDAGGPKVAYSSDAASLFDRAAEVARRDRAAKIEPIHLLAAFANVKNGLMGQLKDEYGLDGTAWRAALARSSAPHEHRGPDVDRPGAVQELLSPDEAADFLGVHTQTVRGYIRSGKLPAHRLAGERAVRIRRRDLLNLLEPYDAEE